MSLAAFRLAVLGAACLLGACAASTSPGYDARFGDAARALYAGQTIDPDAARRHAGILPPVDGRTTREVMDRALGSYKAPPPPSMPINIVVGH
ncbi:MAG: hypothetical protein KGL43_04055 [Burkholderiales bacterium]|nr:hypothetical protein [Burkholderiales bacterium]MDE2452744.1 hypothetical protein [Burkholderiales bacterium]